MRILFFFFSLLLAMLLCLSAIACKLFIVTAKDALPPIEASVVTLDAETEPLTMEGLPVTLLPIEEKTSEDKTVSLPLTNKKGVLKTATVSDKDYYVTVSVNGAKERMSLHEYLVGILLAELPMGFCEDARYAQAVAARSYIVHYVERGMGLGPWSCAYYTRERAREKYTHLYDIALEQAIAAVEATDGIILTYGNKACMAAFHAMSYDKTESAGAVWGEEMPYLVPVSTPEDIEMGGMETSYTFSQKELSALLGGECRLPMTYTASEGGRVDRVTFASGDSYAATEVRSALSLRSTAFASVTQNKKQITITVLGYGHGVGMSQWGAQMMALGGHSWRQILSHYYMGASLDTLSSRFD